MIVIQSYRASGIEHFLQKDISVGIIGSITDKVVQKYMKEHTEESRREGSHSMVL